MRFRQHSSARFSLVPAAALALCLFTTGRPLSASEQRPGAPAPGEPRPAAPAPGATISIGVEEAVQLALKNNLGLEAERLAPHIATFGVAQARAAYAPTLFSTTTKSSSSEPPGNFLTGTGNVITGGAVRSVFGVAQAVPWGGGQYQVSFLGARSTTTGFSNFNPAMRGSLDVAFTQPLLRNFKIDGFRQQLMLSRNDEQVADLELRQRVVQISRGARNAYYNLVGAISGLQVAQQSLDLAREQLRNNQRRVEVGVMAPIDILEAEAEVARVEEAVIVAETQIRSAEDTLRAIVLNPSQPDFWTTRIVPSEQPTLTPRSIDVDAAVQNALANRTDLAALRKRVEATNINLEYLRNQRLPAVDLQANYGVVGLAGTQFDWNYATFPPTPNRQTQRSFGDALRDVFGNEFRSWSVQFIVRYPLGTSAADAALAGTRLQRQQQQTGLRELEMQIATQVRDAARRVTTSLQRVETTRKARQLAEQRLQAEEKRLEVGLSDTFRVFQVQRDLAGARRSELQAVIDYNQALVDFEVVQTVPVFGR